MPGKLTFFPLQRASRFVVVREGDSVEIGRDPACSFVIDDARVSRNHARLRWTGKGWTLEDLGSKNGTTVNGRLPNGAELQEGDWISLGGLSGRFEQLSATQAATLETQRIARIHTTARIQRRLHAGLEPRDLLPRLLDAAIELTQTERGFVLVARSQGVLRVEVARGFTAQELHDERFRGSVGAVRQSLETGEPIVVSHARADPRLGQRPSVVAQGIGSLACIPLCHAERMLGVIYVDSRKIGPAFSELDLQSLEAVADHAAAVLTAALETQRTWPLPPRAGELLAQLQQRILDLLPAV
jgi:hypothetical protein